MRIAYIGDGFGTSLHRARALQRLGHNVALIDPWAWIGTPHWLGRLHFHSGYIGVGTRIADRLLKDVEATNPDLVWVNQGEFVGPSIVQRLRRFEVPLVNYANDNPFSPENGKRFSRYRAALPHYDVVVVVFQDAVEMAIQAGARKVIRKFISADEVAHCLRLSNSDSQSQHTNDVVFIGTWMKEWRGAFIAKLIRLGVPLSIWGDHWQKAKEWSTIRPYWRGPGVYDDKGYADIIRSGKICLGLVNKTAGNLHTDRSIQIPALGSLLCAERTIEHLEMYEEGREAVFWNDAHECAMLCHELLSDDKRRAEIAARGHKRSLQNNLFNEPIIDSILKEVRGSAKRN